MKFFTVEFLIPVILCVCLICGAAVQAADLPDEGPAELTETFDAFMNAAEGRYFTETEDGTAVLELIPAFGRLFASVGYYMESRSLYSYYAAELIPVCLTQPGICYHNHSVSSFDLTVRLFSNMAMAGNYLPGETVQRLTLTGGGLMLSHYSGSGDALISKTAMLLFRNDNVPGMFIYGPEYPERTGNAGQMLPLPEMLQGGWQMHGAGYDVQFFFGQDGMMYYLRDQGTGQPPLLLKGGFWLPEETNGLYRVCYLMSSPSSGTMPYSGCVNMRTDGDFLTAMPAPMEYDELFLPEGSETVRYERGGK